MPSTPSIRSGGWSLIVGAIAFIAVFSFRAARAPLAAISNYLLPLWMIVFGVVMVRWRTVRT